MIARFDHLGATHRGKGGLGRTVADKRGLIAVFTSGQGLTNVIGRVDHFPSGQQRREVLIARNDHFSPMG